MAGGSNFMVAIALIHMCQVFPVRGLQVSRELTWTHRGLPASAMTLGMAFTGQVLRFDQDAYWGLGIGASILGRLPLIGGPAVSLMLGGPILGGATLSRLFTLACLRRSQALPARAGVELQGSGWFSTSGSTNGQMPGRINARKATL